MVINYSYGSYADAQLSRLRKTAESLVGKQVVVTLNYTAEPPEFWPVCKGKLLGFNDNKFPMIKVNDTYTRTLSAGYVDIREAQEGDSVDNDAA